MTFLRFKRLTRSLLTSDYPLPEEDDEVVELLNMAYIYLVDQCDVLNLSTLDKSEAIQRLGQGSYMMRTPKLPEADEDELDVDDALGPVVASLVASYLSEKKAILHQSRADNGIRSYNAKVAEMVNKERYKECSNDV